jgi:hypothetical protein
MVIMCALEACDGDCVCYGFQKQRPLPLFMFDPTVLQVRFVTLLQVTATDAESLTTHILKLLQERGWDIAMMMEFGSDGAAITMGEFPRFWWCSKVCLCSVWFEVQYASLVEPQVCLNLVWLFMSVQI